MWLHIYYLDDTVEHVYVGDDSCTVGNGYLEVTRMRLDQVGKPMIAAEWAVWPLTNIGKFVRDYNAPSPKTQA